jgi:putative transposase
MPSAIQEAWAISFKEIRVKSDYKSPRVESDRHFLTLVRYVERNAKRAAPLKKAEDWPSCSAHARLRGNAKQKKLLSPSPLAEPRHYREWLNQSQGEEEIENIRYAIKKSRPYGSEEWVAKAVAQFGLENTTRNRGRPRNGS